MADEFKSNSYKSREEEEPKRVDGPIVQAKTRKRNGVQKFFRSLIAGVVTVLLHTSHSFQEICDIEIKGQITSDMPAGLSSIDIDDTRLINSSEVKQDPVPLLPLRKFRKESPVPKELMGQQLPADFGQYTLR